VTRVRRVSLLCVLAVALAACSGGASNSSSPAPPTTTMARNVGVPGTSSAPGCPTFAGSTVRAESFGPRPLGLLTDATAGEAGCLDQVTFFFRSLGDGVAPGYVVEYAHPPFMDGDPPRQISMDGAAFLSVTMLPAATVDVSTDDHKRTYFGNLFLQYGAHHHLVLVRKLVDVPGGVRWIIALDAERPFLVDSAVDPTRITVYIG
jgi:hypothetical protein